MNHTCGGCDATWGGQGIAHCSTCHETFSIIQHFDAHRAGSMDRRRCVDPASIRHQSGIRKGERKLKRNANGVWVGAVPRPEELNA